MRMVGAEFGTDLRGPTVCEVIDEAQVADVVARLGPDPLRRDADPGLAVGANQQVAQADRRIADGSKPSSPASATSTATSSLFRHGVDPYRTGASMGEAEFTEAWTDLVDLMKVGVRRGKIITVRPEHDHGAALVRSRKFGPVPTLTAVPATRAGSYGTAIRTAELEGRNVFWCPTCQT